MLEGSFNARCLETASLFFFVVVCLFFFCFLLFLVMFKGKKKITGENVIYWQKLFNIISFFFFVNKE